MADPTVKKNDARLQLTLPSHLKERLRETGNANEYLRSAAQDRMKDARASLALLESEGWGEDEILAVFDVLNGFAVTYSMPLGEQIAAEMEDAAELHSVHEKWGIEHGEWTTLAYHVQENEPVARALRDIATEVWGPSDHLPLGAHAGSDDE